MEIDAQLHPTVPSEEYVDTLRIAEFGLTFDVAQSDVRRMLDLGVLEIVSTMGGRMLMWADGLTPAQGKAAYRAILRVRRVV